MTEFVFFYGTLLRRLNSPARRQVDQCLRCKGRGSIPAALFDLGAYPAAIPSPHVRVHGEVLEMSDPRAVLAVLDAYEGFDPTALRSSEYVRTVVAVTLEDGSRVDAWVYFYNAPLGAAQPIESGDYLQHLTTCRKISGWP